MADLRTILSAVLGVGLGVVLLAFPTAVVRVQTVGRLPDDRGGEYGQPVNVPDHWLWLVRVVGALLVASGLYFGATALGLAGLP